MRSKPSSVILADDIQTDTCCNRRNTSVFRRLQHCVREKGSVKFLSPTDCVELYNRGCGTRTVENLTPYRMKSGTVPTKGFRSTSWGSVCGALPFAHDRPLRMQFYDWLHLHVAFELLFAQQSSDMRSVLYMRPFSTFETVVSG